jgi:HEAT repeat protein
LGQGDGRGDSLRLAGFKVVGASAMRAILFSVVLLFLRVPPRAAIVAADAPPAAADAKHIERLVKQLGSKDFTERERAMKEIIAVGAAALPRLQSATKDRDLEIAQRAKQCIEEIKINEKVVALIADLKNPNPKVRRAAAHKIMRMRSLAKAAVPTLIQALDDRDSSVRLEAARALEMVGPGAKAAIPRLTQLLNDQRADKDLRRTAAIALSSIGKEAENAVPELLRMLEEKDPWLRNGATNALAVLGRNHKEVVPALLRALNTKDAMALASAGAALGILGKDPERCVPALLRALQGAGSDWGDNDPRQVLMGALGLFGPAAKPAISTIAEIAGNEKESLRIRVRAISTLRRIGPDAKEALLALQKKYSHFGLSHDISLALKAIEANAAQQRHKDSGR